MEFFHSVITQDVTTSADGVVTADLNIRPTSHLIITIKALNNGTNTKATLAQLLGGLEKVEVLQFGATIVSLSALDLYALNCILLGHEPWQENVANLDDSTRMVSLIVPFGRRLYDPNECFPAVRAGELQLQTTIDIADTGYDGWIEQVEQVELPGATPKRHLKYATKNYTPSATGDADVDLPMGNTYAGILLWGTTIPTGTSWTTTIDKTTLLVNNEEKYYSKVNWESLHGMLINRCDPANQYDDHTHLENTATEYTQNADTAAAEQNDTIISNHAYLDFDPRGDDNFLLDSSALSALKLTISAGDTNATRIIPVELMNV